MTKFKKLYLLNEQSHELPANALRKLFKEKIDHALEILSDTHEMNDVFILKIQKISTEIEELIQKKEEYLIMQFKPLPLKDDYTKTVNESFTDLKQFLMKSPTLMDIVQKEKDLKDDFHIQSKKIKYSIEHYYTDTLVPLLNIIAKLENDYISFMNQEKEL